MGIGFSTSTKEKFIIDQKITFWTKSETAKLPRNMAQSSNLNAVCASYELKCYVNWMHVLNNLLT